MIFSIVVMPPVKAPVLKICAPRLASSALLAIASAQNFFRREGLNVEFTTEELGRKCLDHMVNGRVDFAVAYVAPVVKAIKKGHGINIITELHSATRNAGIVYRKDAIDNDDDLRGKKIAVTKGTSSEGLLRMYMLAHDLKEESFTLVNAKPDDMQWMIETGVVDAVVAWEPYLTRILNTNEYSFLESSFNTEFSMLLSRSDAPTAVTDAIPGILLALHRAQEYAVEDPESAQMISRKALQFDEHDLSPSIWAKSRFRLGLSAVLEAMLQLSRTSAEKGEIVALSEPRQYFVPQYLDQTFPELVTYR